MRVASDHEPRSLRVTQVQLRLLRALLSPAVSHSLVSRRLGVQKFPAVSPDATLLLRLGAWKHPRGFFLPEGGSDPTSIKGW